LRIAFNYGKSLMSGYGSFRESASAFFENWWLALIRVIWTFSSLNLLWSAILAARFATHVGEKSAP
jgi:hypothetical protein